MAFLDNAGLAHFAAWVKNRLSGKQDALEPDASIRVQGGTIAVALPTKAMSQAEYEALSEAEKNAEALYMTPETGGGVLGPVKWENIDGRPDLSKVSALECASVTLLAAAWDQNGEQWAAVSSVSADEAAQLIVPAPHAASAAVYYESDLKLVEQQEGRLCFRAETAPAEDVSVYVYIIGAAEVGKEFVGQFVWWSPKMTGNNTPAPYAAFASSEFTGRPAYLAFDENLELFWTSSAGDNLPSITFDFGAETAIKGVSIHPLSGGNRQYAENDTPKTFNVYGSNDNDSWTLLYTGTNDSYADEYLPFEFSKAASYRYCKIGDMVPFNSGVISIAEIQFYKLEAAQ